METLHVALEIFMSVQYSRFSWWKAWFPFGPFVPFIACLGFFLPILVFPALMSFVAFCCSL